MHGRGVLSALFVALMLGCVSVAGIDESEDPLKKTTDEEQTEVRSGEEGRGPPTVQDLWFSEDRVNRTQEVMLYVDASDDTDPAQDLDVAVEHRVNGSTTWSSDILGNMVFNEGLWQWDVTPKVDTLIGYYDFRASVEDTGGNSSGHAVFPNALEVLNYLPTAPEVRILPQRPVTTSTLIVELVKSAIDIDSSGLTYRYRWYCDGELKDHLTGDSLGASETTKGQNWSVEVRAYDGIGEGTPGIAWKVIQNSGVLLKDPLPDPMIDEDTTDSDWLDLTTAFEDADGDPLTWSVDPTPANIVVEIDPVSGRVTLSPAKDWNGVESITFVATDGEFQVSQTVTVMVLPVNDRPLFVDSLGNPVTLDKMTINVYEGQEVVLPFWVHDIEGDEVLASVNSTLVELDEANRQIHLSPTVVVVGTITFTLAIWDVEEPSVRITRDFKVIVENLNDPMDDPEILAPTSGTMIWQGLPTSFMAVCWDPDIQYGQELVFSWISSISGWMGTGASILVALHEIGVHEIQLTVSDGEYMKTTSIEIIVAEYDNDGDGIADSADDFPTDPAASVDSDEDGYPDEWNEGKTAADSITGLKIDDFPTDPAASDDTDGDGYPDEWNEGKTAADSITGLKIDKYPKDAKRWEEEDDSPSVGLVGVIAAIGIIAGVMRRRGRS